MKQVNVFFHFAYTDVQAEHQRLLVISSKMSARRDCRGSYCQMLIGVTGLPYCTSPLYYVHHTQSLGSDINTVSAKLTARQPNLRLGSGMYSFHFADKQNGKKKLSTVVQDQ